MSDTFPDHADPHRATASGVRQDAPPFSNEDFDGVLALTLTREGSFPALRAGLERVLDAGEQAHRPLRLEGSDHDEEDLGRVSLTLQAPADLPGRLLSGERGAGELVERVVAALEGALGAEAAHVLLEDLDAPGAPEGVVVLFERGCAGASA